MQCAAERKYCAGVLGQLRGYAAAQPRSLEGTLHIWDKLYARYSTFVLCEGRFGQKGSVYERTV